MSGRPVFPSDPLKGVSQQHISKLKQAGVPIPSSLGKKLDPKARELMLKLLKINTNVSSGTFAFNEIITILRDTFPSLQGHIDHAMKVFKSNSVGVTKAYFRLLMGGRPISVDSK
jgi:hypothetical protein